ISAWFKRQLILRIGYNVGREEQEGSMHNHAEAFVSRRDFVTGLFGGVLSAGILKGARYCSAWTQELVSVATPGHFEIQRVPDDVYFAQAQPWALPNSNAAIFVNSTDVLVVDAHYSTAVSATLVETSMNAATSAPVLQLTNANLHSLH